MKVYSEIKKKLKDNGFKVTPQRVTVFEALTSLNHPTADQVMVYVRRNHPGVATGTVYHILESFVERGLIRKVKTDRDIMRYDAIAENHHHLYCASCDVIVDYFDEELDELLDNYFKKKRIPNFSVSDMKLQIVGKFTNDPVDEHGNCISAKNPEKINP